MTCIIGIEHAGKVYMGGDSAAAEGWNIRKIAHPKVFIKDSYIIGYTTSFRMGQIIEHIFEPPQRETKYQTDLSYLVSQFIPALRECMKQGGYSKIENNQETGGEFLVGYLGHLYKIESDFSVIQHQNPCIDAIGCGSPYALGATTALLETHHPQNTILKALEITGQFSNGVCGPYYVYSV